MISNGDANRQDSKLDLGPFETALLAELRLGLPPLFYFRLIKIADDWTFVLKLHSFFEGALTQLIKEKLRGNSKECFSPRDSFVSRVHLASRMMLLEPDFSSFLMSLNRLRNDIAHNVRFIDFDLNSYVDSLPESSFRRLALTLCSGLKNMQIEEFPLQVQMARKNARRRDCKTIREVFFGFSPKMSIWNSGLWTLDLISLHSHFEIAGDSFVPERDIQAKLQDLLLDPEVLEFRRSLTAMYPFGAAGFDQAE